MMFEMRIITQLLALLLFSTTVYAQSGAFIPADRMTTWNPGLNAVGGIPNRTTICATVSPKGGTQDDTAAIQAAREATSMEYSCAGRSRTG